MRCGFAGAQMKEVIRAGYVTDTEAGQIPQSMHIREPRKPSVFTQCRGSEQEWPYAEPLLLKLRKSDKA